MRPLLQFTTLVALWLLPPFNPDARGADSLSARHPADAGIERDPAVLFAESFESGGLQRWDQVRGLATVATNAPHAGRFCAQMELRRDANSVSDAIKWFLPGADTVHGRNTGATASSRPGRARARPPGRTASSRR